jgi:DNA-binding transcriptional LysR family regulator
MTFESMQLGTVEIFCKAAQLGSFSAAAMAQGVTPAAVSRSISRLEARLGVRLFVRTTRSIRLTADGQLYKSQCQQALDQIAEAERAITGNQKVPSGVLRISAPSTYAQYRLMPLLPKFSLAFPKIEIEVNVSNRNIDFVDDDYDLAIRLGEPLDSRMISRKLEDASLGVFASALYLKRFGTPKTLLQLKQHDCIQFVLPSTGKPMPWIFNDGKGLPIDFNFVSRHRVQEDVLGCVHWARAGGGLFQIYHFVAQDLVRRGELVEVLKPLAKRSRQFSILYPQNRHLSARVRAFVEFLTRSIR